MQTSARPSGSTSEKKKNGEGAFGYNAQTDTYEDLMKAGIMDPTKVVRFAIQNAASVASLMLTTQAMIAEKPEEKKQMYPGTEGMGGAEQFLRVGSNAAVKS